jgi:hypothetical protein
MMNKKEKNEGKEKIRRKKENKKRKNKEGEK